MHFLLSMPGGAEWITLIIIGTLFFAFPALALIYFLRNKELKKKLEQVTKERDELMNNIIL